METEKKAFHFLVDIKRHNKLVRVAAQRGKHVIQMFRDWVDGIKEDK